MTLYKEKKENWICAWKTFWIKLNLSWFFQLTEEVIKIDLSLFEPGLRDVLLL